MNEKIDVLIEGAGLSGLACAQILKKNNISFKIIEASGQVGGRVKTEKLNGFTLDHGFQILLTSYPELENFLNLEKLDLCYFNSGAKIYQPSGSFVLANPAQHLATSLSSTLWADVSLKDKSLVAKLLFKAITKDYDESSLKNTSTKIFLEEYGFSAHFIDLFWKPFFKGIYLDNNLGYDSAYFMFLMRNFAFGKTALPKLGMQQIPVQMAENIGNENIILNEKIANINFNSAHLSSGKTIDYRYRVSAFNADINPESFNKTTTYYFETDELLENEKWLYVIPTNLGFKINNLIVLNNISEDYCKTKGSLISVSTIGEDSVDENLLVKEMQQILSQPSMSLKFIKMFQIKNALPKKYHNGEQNFNVDKNHYRAGDYMCTPSINGALQSGRLVAENIVKEFYEQSV